MSIVTKTGDQGTTGLMYNRRISKCHPRVEAYGAVDELNAAMGLARASATHPFIGDNLLAIQKQLVILMGELATQPEDLARFKNEGYSVVAPDMITPLEALVKEIESQNITYKGWATPGASVSSATLDLSRTICRRAERRVASLLEGGQLQNREILIYLNRLSDLLWLFARWVEEKNAAGAINSRSDAG